MSKGFDFHTTRQLVDIFTDITKNTLKRERPAPRYATVVTYSRARATAMVAYSGEEDNPVPVTVSNVRPLAIGARVLIDGLPNNRHIVEAPGGQAPYFFETESGIPDGGLAQSHSRLIGQFVDSTTTMPSGVEWGSLVYLPRITEFTQLCFLSGGTVDLVATSQWAVITDVLGNVVAASNDDTTNPWFAGDIKPFTFATPQILSANHYYCFVGYVATTPIKLVGKSQHVGMSNIAPYTSVTAGGGALVGSPSLGGTVDLTSNTTFAPYCYFK